MKQTPPNGTAEQHVREIRRKTRTQYSSEEKIRIVISGLPGEHSIAELCRREGIAESLYYVWSKEFMEAGKKRLVLRQNDRDVLRLLLAEAPSHLDWQLAHKRRGYPARRHDGEFADIECRRRAYWCQQATIEELSNQ
jgi:transposase-like protein